MDKYDVAIAYLRQCYEEDHVRMIFEAWNSPMETNPGSALFQFTYQNGYKIHHSCGCLTQVRSGKVAATPELTLEISKDSRIPMDFPDIEDFNWTHPEDIKEYKQALRPIIDALEVFAEWQRRLYIELNRNEAVNGQV
jgi:hypothetical protein